MAADSKALFDRAVSLSASDVPGAVALLRQAKQGGFDVAGEVLGTGDLELLASLTLALPEEGDGWLQYARALIRAGRSIEAIASASEAITRMPGYANALSARAAAHARAGHAAEALADLAQALEIDPGLRLDLAADPDFAGLGDGLQRLIAPKPRSVEAEEADPAPEADSATVRYEFKEGTSSKFWEIALDGASFTTTFGKIGAAGQTSTKDFDDDSAAEAAYAKLIAEKVKKGYVLVKGRPVGAPPDFKANPGLEQAILADLADPNPWLVYADWLQAQGDPRGELAALQHAGKTAAEKRLLEAHPAALLGPLAKDPERFSRLEWRFGFLKSVKVSVDYETYEEGYRLEKLVRSLLEHPVARFLEELVFGAELGEGEADYQKCVDLLVKLSRPASLRSLFLADFTSEECEVSWSRLGNLGKLYAAFPGLERLTLHAGSMTLGKIDLPALREFHLLTGGLSRKSIKDVCGARWPRLETLELWFGNHSYGAEGTVQDLAPLLAAQGLPNLKHLGLKNAEFTDDICKALVGSKVLRQLETLDLSMGCMTAAGVEAILSAKDRFQHLRRLDVSDNALEAGADEPLVGLCPEVVTGRHTPDRVQGEYRYTAVGE